MVRPIIVVEYYHEKMRFNRGKWQKPTTNNCISQKERISPQIVVPPRCPHHILLYNPQFNYPVRVELYDRTRFLQQIPRLRSPVCKAGVLITSEETIRMSDEI